jgi:DNA/RNA-binding domain of Phe-tRNA-synthetase-like protein
MRASPAFETHLSLPDWELFWAELELVDPAAAAGEVAELRQAAEVRLRARASLETLAGLPVVTALRRLFKAAGCDPSRYRPSSEALARRVLKGEGLPAVHPLVDVNNALSIDLLVPCCVLAAGSVVPPVELRVGRAGEVLDAMRGPLDLEGKPLLADAHGPFGTPITDSHRVKVQPETTRALVVAYLPAGQVSLSEADTQLSTLVAGLRSVVRPTL